MSISRLVATVLLMTAASIGWSQTSPEDHAGHQSPEKNQPANIAAQSKDAMAAARGLIERAEHAATASERESLLDEHLAAMRKQLDSLKSQQCMMDMMDGAAMGAGKSDGTRPRKMGEGMERDHMMTCHHGMKNRMEAMAELLEQTWRREELRKRGSK